MFLSRHCSMTPLLLLLRQRSILPTSRQPQVVLLLLLPFLLSGCLPFGGPAKPRPLTPPPGAQRGGGSTGGDVIAFIPVGNFPARTLNELADYFRQSLGVKIEVLPPMGSTFAERRGSQVIAQSLIDVLRQEHTRRRFLIGFTGEDLGVQDGSLNFTFAQYASYESGRKVAVISTTRLEPAFNGGGGGKRNKPLLVQRLRKITAKQIGRMVYGLPNSQDPDSVMYGGINSVRDIDNMSGAY